eukprot:jgi/Tetstr1/428160/TSEL_018211.t1
MADDDEANIKLTVVWEGRLMGKSVFDFDRQWRETHTLRELLEHAVGEFDNQLACSIDVLALAGVRAWAEYEANTDADDAVICPPTRTLLALLEVREVWKARRSADSVRLELLDHEAARLLQDVCRDAVLALPFGDQSQGRVVIQVTVEHSEDREDQPTTPLP